MIRVLISVILGMIPIMIALLFIKSYTGMGDLDAMVLYVVAIISAATAMLINFMVYKIKIQ